MSGSWILSGGQFVTKISRERWQSICLESFIKEQQGFVFRGNIIFLTVDFGMNHRKPIFFPLNFLVFLFNYPLPSLQDFFCTCAPKAGSGSDCQGFQSCATPVLDLVKLLWTRNISDFLVNTHFSMKLGSPLHIPEVSSAHTNTPMHTDNAQVLTQ